MDDLPLSSNRPPHVGSSTKVIVVSLLALSGFLTLWANVYIIDLSQYLPPIDDIVYPIYQATTATTLTLPTTETRRGIVSQSPIRHEDLEPILALRQYHISARSRMRTINDTHSDDEYDHDANSDYSPLNKLHHHNKENDMLDDFIQQSSSSSSSSISVLLNNAGHQHLHHQQQQWINQTIRRWGCHRTETPLIFVHIGKAGGGMIRARFAAAAMDYDREEWHVPHKDQHYYPISTITENTVSNRNNKAHFCNSQYRTFHTPDTQIWARSFEGNLPCLATTPIGMALACPETATIDRHQRCLGCQDWHSKDCHTVYVGHNNLGSELHWLPPKYLRNWWQSTQWSSTSQHHHQNLTVDWRGIYDGKKYAWCHTSDEGPRFRSEMTRSTYKSLFEECSVPIGDYWDTKVEDFWRQIQQEYTVHGNELDGEGDGSKRIAKVPLNFSPLYASLPVQRVTMVREPWAWLVSKFFWHHDLDSEHVCDDLNYATEWTHTYALQYIGNLCGGDCPIRYERHQMSLEELWIQSESNLRHAFSVIGLMNETMTFYEMLSTRVAFLDMSRNPHVQGQRHESGRTRETVRCRKVFQQEDFQAALSNQVPILRVLDRLYHVAVLVNRFQLEELRQCQGPRGSLWSKQHFH